jgi:predicted nucleic acid-binding protein
LADLFADSYALVALLEGNERYVRIFRRKSVATSALNLLEVYSTLLRRLDRTEAKELAGGIVSMVVPVPVEVAFSAGEFRQVMRSRKRDCSYIDAWGYAAAQLLGVPFLTGDPAFRQIEGVEFVR